MDWDSSPDTTDLHSHKSQQHCPVSQDSFYVLGASVNTWNIVPLQSREKLIFHISNDCNVFKNRQKKPHSDLPLPTPLSQLGVFTGVPGFIPDPAPFAFALFPFLFH